MVRAQEGVRRGRCGWRCLSRDDAIAVLGVGKNMVRSIRHWCSAAGIVQETTGEDTTRSGRLEPTAFGRRIFGTNDGLDPYLEDSATLWLIHWQIASNQSRAGTWYWTFSHFNEPDFSFDALSAAIYRWAQTLPGKKIAPRCPFRNSATSFHCSGQSAGFVGFGRCRYGDQSHSSHSIMDVTYAFPIRRDRLADRSSARSTGRHWFERVPLPRPWCFDAG